MTDLLARLRITADAKDATREVAGVHREMTQLRQAGGQAKAGLDQAAAGADHLQRSAGGADRQARLLVAALAGFSIKAFTSDISDAAFKTQGFTTGLTAVAGGARNAANEQAFLRTEAARLGLVVQDQVQGFMGLAGATNGTALAGQATREIWLGLAEAGTALNRSSEQQGRALEATAQIASKGVLSMEELRGQLSEAIPGAMQIAARAMGMTTAQLNKMVADGKVASEDFLPKFAAELRRTFGPTLDEAMNTPLGQARKELAATKTAIFDLQSAAGSEFLGAATAGIAAFNAQLSSADTEQAARRLGASLGEGAALAANGAALLVENIDAVVFATQALTGIAVVRWLAGLSVEARKAALAAREKAAAQLAAAQAANLEAKANMTAATSLTAYVRAANTAVVADRNLADAKRSTAAASIGMRTALGGVVSFLGGPWGIAFLAAGLAVAALSAKMADAEQRAADLERGLDLVDEINAETKQSALDLARGLDVATAATNRAADAARTHAQELAEERKQVIATAMAAAERNLSDAKARATDSSPMRWAYAESVNGGADFAQAQQRASTIDVPKAQKDLDDLREKFNALAAAASTRSRGVGGEQARIDRENAAVEAAPAVVAAHDAVSDAADKRTKKSKEVREAEQQLARANDLTDKLKLDTGLQKERALAVVQGAAAIEALQIKEAGLQALQQIGVTSLDQLSGAQRQAAEAAMAAAEAYERQAIATEKVERVADATKDLDRRIAAERARTVAITGGVRASLDYAKAEAVRQAVERAGENLTADQIEQIRTKVELLMQIEAINDNAASAQHQAEELELLTLTNREREIEIRARQKAIELQRENVLLTDEEAKVRARIGSLRGREERRTPGGRPGRGGQQDRRGSIDHAEHRRRDAAAHQPRRVRAQAGPGRDRGQLSGHEGPGDRTDRSRPGVGRSPDQARCGEGPAGRRGHAQARRGGRRRRQARLANYNKIMADIQGLAGMSLSAPSGNDALAAQMKLLGIPLDKLVLTGELTKAANDDIVAAMAPSLAVSLANMPTLKAAYGEVAKIETDRVVAALDLLRADLKAGLAAIKDDQSSSALQTALEAVNAALGQNAEASAELSRRAWDQSREASITNALIRLRS